MKRETENTEKYILYIETCNGKREKKQQTKITNKKPLNEFVNSLELEITVSTFTHTVNVIDCGSL